MRLKFFIWGVLYISAAVLLPNDTRGGELIPLWGGGRSRYFFTRCAACPVSKSLRIAKFVITVERQTLKFRVA